MSLCNMEINNPVCVMVILCIVTAVTDLVVYVLVIPLHTKRNITVMSICVTHLLIKN